MVLRSSLTSLSVSSCGLRCLLTSQAFPLVGNSPSRLTLATPDPIALAIRQAAFDLWLFLILRTVSSCSYLRQRALPRVVCYLSPSACLRVIQGTQASHPLFLLRQHPRFSLQRISNFDQIVDRPTIDLARPRISQASQGIIELFADLT